MVTLAPTAPTPFDQKNWGERVDMNTIRKIRVPQLGPDTWRPLPHETYVDMIEQAFSRPTAGREPRPYASRCPSETGTGP